ncbi:Alpha/Beta hydrolase protein [Suillus lakei]|nr:Alpha/Beta hydrolase protein [Suillus lakei]
MVASYLGIPYAEPPVGDLRFRATVALTTTRVHEEANLNGEAVLNATSYPDSCIQGTTSHGYWGRGLTMDAGGAGSEGCLKVSIYSPDVTRTTVPIYSSGYVRGNPRNWPCDSWINQSPNINHRFTDPTYGDFNAGFKVQALTLSINAGGSSVELHMIANEGEKRFSGAIAQSPLFQFYTSYAGCGTGLVAGQTDMPPWYISALARAQAAAVQGRLYVLCKALTSAADGRQFRRNEFVHVPIIVGATSNETRSGGASVSLALTEFFPSLVDADIWEFLWLYPVDEFDSPSQQVQVATGEPELVCGRQAMGSPSSLYSNTWTHRGTDAVAHTAENLVMFDGTNTGFSGLAGFTPQTTSPAWEQYTEFNPVRIVLMQDQQNLTNTSGSYMERRPASEAVRCAFAISKAQSCENQAGS